MPPGRHQLQVGWKLEALHPGNHSHICPATVTKVINDQYFIVQIDDVSQNADGQQVQMCCHGSSPGILPVNWCRENGTALTPPEGMATVVSFTTIIGCTTHSNYTTVGVGVLWDNVPP